MSNSKATIQEVYQVVISRFDRLEDKMEGIEGRMDTRFLTVEGRVDKVESFQANLTGKITVLGAVMMVAVNFLWDMGRNLVKKII